jgi:hypothetical protein
MEVMRLFGFNYVVNLSTREVHDLRCCGGRRQSCNPRLMTHKVYVWGFVARALYRFGFNGCYWCNRRHDTDRRVIVKMKRV